MDADAAERKAGRWLLLTVGLTCLLLLPFALFNYYIDPMWTFSHSNAYNTDQMPFDERQQKTNHLTFAPESCCGLLIGSSRCSYIDEHDFDESVYNYAVSNIQLPEYVAYISYAAEKMGTLETVYVGLDFYETNRNQTPNEVSPAEIIAHAKEPGYRFKLLLSRDTLSYSWKNYKASRETQYPVNFAYNRENVKRLSRVPLEQTWQMEMDAKERFREGLYANYAYDTMPEQLKKIKNASPGSQFVAFTTPVHENFFALLGEMGLYDAYEQWLRDSVAVFGRVYHFMYLNDITQDLSNFYDGSHLYPEIAAKMVAFIQGRGDETEDFGIVLTPENIEENLEMLRARTQRAWKNMEKEQE